MSSIARLRSLLEDLRGRGLSELGQARLYSALARLLASNGAFHSAGEDAISRLTEALAAAERAMALARAAGHDGVLARAQLSQAIVLNFLGRVEEGLDGYEELLPLAKAAGDLQTLLMGLIQAQAQREFRGDFALSQRHLESGLALRDRVGDPKNVAHLWMNQAELAYYRGDWALAHTAVARSLELVRTYDLAVRFPDAQYLFAQLSLAAGEREQFEALAAEPLALAHKRHNLQLLRIAHSLIAERDLLGGRPEAVRTYLEPLLDRPGFDDHEVLFVLPQFAWALLTLGDEAAAEACARQTCERARAHHHHLWLVDGLRVLAMVRTRQERWEDARAMLEEAIELSRDMPYPYAEAKARYVYGQLHAAKREPEQAREKYRAALAICDRLGEGLYRPYIERALGELP